MGNRLRPSRPRQIHAQIAREDDPALDEFARRMGRTESITRAICTVLGVLSALAALGLFWWVGMFGGVFFGILAAVLLLRGLARQGADLEFLTGLGFMRGFRLWWR